MSGLQVFENPAFGSVRTLTENGKTLFCAVDIARPLGYAKPHNAIQAHCPHALKRGIGVQTGTKADGSPAMQEIEMAFIPEGDVYRLIARSRLPEAQKFESWIFDEVVPSIRKTGGYIAGSADMSDMEIMSKAFLIAQRTICERDAAIKRLESDNRAMSAEIAAFAPVRGYVNEILSSPGTLTTTQIAADYGMSARKLNDILREEKIQHKVNGQWILYREQMEKGYTKSVTIPIKHRDGTPDTKMHTQWTQKGRLMIHGILTRRGVLANADSAEAEASP